MEGEAANGGAALPGLSMPVQWQPEGLQLRRLQTVQRLALEAALLEIAGTFEARGIDYLVLKGAAFARWLYEDPATRAYQDLDLLVAPHCFEAAERGLSDIGYRPERDRLYRHERAEHHDAWLRMERIPARVELHRTIYWPAAPPSRVWELLSADSRVIAFGTGAIAVPSEEASALLVALHAAQHGAAWPKPMEDLRRAVARADIQVWRGATELAQQLDALDAFAAGLRLVPCAAELCHRLDLPQQGSRLVRLHAATPPDTAVGIERLVCARGLTGRLRLVAQELWPSPAFMRAWKPLARRGLPGLAAAYLWRPFWLAAKLPSGWRAWRRAATGSGNGA